MKRQLSQPNKWLLTTALLAVLGTNYSLQTSSIEVARTQAGKFDLASEASVLTPDGSIRIAPNMSIAKKSDIKLTEAVSSLASEVCESGDCKNVPASALLKIEAENKELMSRITELEAKLVTQTVEVKAEPEVMTAQDRLQELRTECNTTDAGEKETPSDRRERIKCEKEAIKTVKEEKENDLREAREEKFEEAITKIQDKCQGDDLKCLTDKFSSLLNKFKGKKALSKSFVNDQFKAVIAPELSKALFNEKISLEDMNGILGKLFNDFPAEYSHIQKATLMSIQKMARDKAATVTAGYKSAEQLSKQNNPAAYLQKLNETQAEQQTLQDMTNAYTASFLGSQAASDVELSSYYKKTYLPDVQDIFSKIMGTTNTTTVNEDGRIVSEKISAILDGTATSTRNNRRGGDVSSLNQLPSTITEKTSAGKPQSRGGLTTRGGSAGTQMPSSTPMPPAPPSYMQFGF